MRLRDIKEIVLSNYKNINFDGTSRGNGTYVVTNFQEAIDSINNLKEFDFIQDALNNLVQIEDIYFNKAREDKVILDSATYSAFESIISSIKDKCDTVIKLINEAIPDQSESSISIKLPDFQDLTKLSEFFNDLDKALTQSLVNEVIKGKVQLQNFDSGSYWVEVAIGGATAMQFVAGLTWTAAVVRKKFLEGDLLKKKVESMGIKNEALEEVKNALTAELDLLIEVESKNLLENQKIDYDHEFLGRVKFSVKTLAKLIYEGTEIHHSLMAPEEVKNLFPDFKKIEAIQSKIKQLE